MPSFEFVEALSFASAALVELVAVAAFGSSFAVSWRIGAVEF
jgi:hypothetical protein